jgi:hypothetical protein
LGFAFFVSLSAEFAHAVLLRKAKQQEGDVKAMPCGGVGCINHLLVISIEISLYLY